MSDEKKGERYEVKVGPETRKKIDKLVNEAAGKRAIVAALDRRYTGKTGSFGPYERYLCSDFFTVYVSLDTFKATLSSKPDRHAEAKYDRREKKAEARAARKEVTKAKAAKAIPVVQYDPSLSTLTGGSMRKERLGKMDEAAVKSIIASKQCTRKAAIAFLKNAAAIKAADLHESKAAKTETVKA
jgi:hypothetical protein